MILSNNCWFYWRDRKIMSWRGTGGREPRRIRAGDRREAGGDGSGSGSHAREGEE